MGVPTTKYSSPGNQRLKSEKDQRDKQQNVRDMYHCQLHGT